MKKIDKERLRTLIGKGKTEQAIKELLVITAKVDEDVHNQVINLQNQYAQLRKEEINNTISKEEAYRRRAIINTALLAIIDSPSDEPPIIPGFSKGGSHSSTSTTNVYVFIFLVLLVVTISTLGVLVAVEDAHHPFIHYCILVIMGLMVGAFTHGVMNSRSRLETKSPKLILQLSGPIVACLLTVVGGYYFSKNIAFGGKEPVATEEVAHQTFPKSGEDKDTINRSEVSIQEETKEEDIQPKRKEDKGSNNNPKSTSSTETPIRVGCTNPCALNFDPKANKNNHSCQLPPKPTVACYQTSTFNDITCEWNVVGDKPTKPSLLCYQIATFNNSTCKWDVTGNPPLIDDDCEFTDDSLDSTTCKPIHTPNCPPNKSFNAEDCICEYEKVNFFIECRGGVDVKGLKMDGKPHEKFNIKTAHIIEVLGFPMTKKDEYLIEILDGYDQVVAKCYHKIDKGLELISMSPNGDCSPTYEKSNN